MIARFRNSFLALTAKVHDLSREPYRRADLSLEIQLELVQRIKYLERRIRIYKASAATDETAWEKIETYRRALTLFRMIGDCIAFIYVDRYDVKPLAHGHDAGFISGKTGLAEEIKTLRLASLREIPCLLADLTNVLKYGDLYAFSPLRPPAILEIKSPSVHKDRRIKRQIERLDNVAEFLNIDFSAKHYRHGTPTYRIGLSHTPKYYTCEAGGLLSEGIRTGLAVQQVEPGLYYAVLRPDRLNELDPIIRKIHKPAVSLLNDSIMNLGDYPYYPVFLSIPDSENVFQLLIWKILFMVIFDVERINSFYKARKISSEFDFDNKSEFVAALTFPAGTTQFDDDVPIRVTRQFFGRVCSEFLSLQDWMEEVIRVVSNIHVDTLPNQLSNLALQSDREKRRLSLDAN